MSDHVVVSAPPDRETRKLNDDTTLPGPVQKTARRQGEQKPYTPPREPSVVPLPHPMPAPSPEKPTYTPPNPPHPMPIPGEPMESATIGP